MESPGFSVNAAIRTVPPGPLAGAGAGVPEVDKAGVSRKVPISFSSPNNSSTRFLNSLSPAQAASRNTARSLGLFFSSAPRKISRGRVLSGVFKSGLIECGLSVSLQRQEHYRVLIFNENAVPREHGLCVCGCVSDLYSRQFLVGFVTGFEGG